MSFIWNGVSSDTMKFNVTSRQVYNAPAYDLNAIEVPGRSGDLLNPQNRFKNKQISYTGFLKATDFEGSTWREKLSTGLIQFKGWLCSDAGQYHELTDDYDPGFTRYGYISGETAISDVQDRPFGVTLTVTFNVKPFMYKAGEPMELPETKSASGSIITITDGAENTPLKSAIVNIEPVQDLHGYDYPWPAGGGKNKFNVSDKTETVFGVTFESNGNVLACNGLAEGGYPNNVFALTEEIPAGTHTVSFVRNDGGKARVTIRIRYKDGSSYAMGNNEQATITHEIPITGFQMATVGGSDYATTVSNIQIEAGSSKTSYAPYSNICPISGWTQVNVWVKPTYDTTLTPTATIPLGRTVYGGTLDVTNGMLTVDREMVDFGALQWTYNSTYAFFTSNSLRDRKSGVTNMISDMFKTQAGSWSGDPKENALWGNGINATIYVQCPLTTVEEFLALVTGHQLCYELATPQEYDLTPQTIKTLLGTNNIWADAGEMSIEYPIPTENPYPFGSRPLYEITMAGTGTLVVNGKEWTITDYTGTLYCDTEAMEWYDASQLRNNIVSGDGWPVFEAGENSVSYTGDITKVMVTPRWRTL